MTSVTGSAGDAVVVRGGLDGASARTSMSSAASSSLQWASAGGFSAAPHQIAGHLFEYGKVGSLVCDSGYFYKPLQQGSRGVRERSFYESLRDAEWRGSGDAGSALLRDLSAFVPAFHGVLELGGTTYVKLEDVTRKYRRPCIADIKIGYQTWCPSETESHIAKCQRKDKATTTSKLGFKVCGMQVHDAETDEYWRATKEWCKTLDEVTVKRSLSRFCDRTSLAPELVRKIEDLETWCERQRLFHFYSASLLVLYDGAAETADDLNLDLKLIDFAHAHQPPTGQAGTRDDNFIGGLRSLSEVLREIG